MTNTFVDTIALPDADAGDFVGSNCVITGWGNTQIGEFIMSSVNIKNILIPKINMEGIYAKGHTIIISSHIRQSNKTKSIKRSF